MRFVEINETRAGFVAKHLRQSDRDEVLYSHGETPWEAVRDSWLASAESYCIEGDSGRPVGLCGVTPAEEGGLIWLLGTDEMLSTLSHRKQFLAHGQAWVDGCVVNWGSLHNWVYNKNQASMRWLKTLGFVIHPARPMGPYSQLFCYFEREAD
jgi:hypothetical protein